MTRFAKASAAALCVAGLLLAAAGLPAQDSERGDEPDKARDRVIWVVEIENDIITNEDGYYTSGTAISRISQLRRPPSWLAGLARAFPGIDEADVLPYRLSGNYNLYTPKDPEQPKFPPDDRPYAAWLNFQFATGAISERGADRVLVGLGLVGPWVQGEKIQKGIHSAISSPRPVGWEHQIRNEPTLQLGYDRLRRFWSAGQAGRAGADATWTSGLMAGSAYSNLTVGGYLRAGHNLPRGYGPPRITPAISGAGYFRPGQAPAWYVYLGMEGRRVFRDLFIQGNTFGGTAGVSRERYVAEGFAGLVYTRGPLRLAYTHVWRSDEFIGQAGRQSYGALSFSLWR